MSVGPEQYATTSNGDVQLSTWCGKHRVLPHLLPFKYRKTTPIEFLDAVVEGLDELPQTAATFTPAQMDDIDVRPAAGANIMTDMLGTLGAWKVDRSSSARWVNPNYVHLRKLDNMIESGDRREIVERCASYGTLTVADVAPRFGISEMGLRRWLTRKGITWSELRQEGITRLARTIHTASAWGHSELRYARVLPRPEGTIRSWVQKYARDVDFEPPADPSGKQWFMGGQVR
ncbi:hypothetical protein C453_12861 [Haloferax elongans ATCC BAA-1513]|uniref:Uncharacterized protein n=1 Tax=Haloferax elongans ATCC BAA-1513 TaxID=1230453 RepID=M0HL42_HALEO|nr:hypothetical protein [Haloferax elongans]ELZ84437.1 hypothetical protein C453_12861 [Haloferax elongans ATCC BAA-1513]